MTGNDLLWSNGQKTGELNFETAVDDLELERLGALLFRGMTGSEAVAFAKNLVTDNWDTIKLRQDAINDLLCQPRLQETFNRLICLSEEAKYYAEGVRNNAIGLEVDRFDAMLDGVKKVIIKYEKAISQQGGDFMEEMSADNRYASLLKGVLFKYELVKKYTEAMTLLHDTLSVVSVKSATLKKLKAWVEEKYISDNVDGIREKLKEISEWWKGIGAFAIDVFLNGRVTISSLAVAEVCADQYEKNGMLDGKQSELREGISSLIKFPQNGSAALFQEYLLNEVGYESKKELLKLRSELARWRLTGQDELISLKDALFFYISAAEMASRFAGNGISVCTPALSEADVVNVKDAVLPELALNGDSIVIPNDCRLGAEGYVSLITGPNSSGKTCYIVLAGQLIWLSQLGCLLPCASACIKPCDSLLTLFAAGESEEGNDSRMGMEVSRLKEITECMTPRSLVLLNEPMTSTSADEGISICIDLILELIDKKVSGMMVTHFVDIYDLLIKKLDKNGVGNRFNSLVMTTDRSDGEITYLFKIKEAPPQKSSYARAVIGRLGVSLISMLCRMDDLGMDTRPEDPAWNILKQEGEL